MYFVKIPQYCTLFLLCVVLQPNSTSANDSSKENSSASRVIKKRLPPTDMATQAKLAQRMIDPKTATPKGGHSYGPYFLEYCLMAE